MILTTEGSLSNEIDVKCTRSEESFWLNNYLIMMSSSLTYNDNSESVHRSLISKQMKNKKLIRINHVAMFIKTSRTIFILEFL